MFNTEALRRFGDGKAGDVSGACRWAADEIERLRLELEKIAWMDEFLDEAGAMAMVGVARAALSSHKGGENEQ